MQCVLYINMRTRRQHKKISSRGGERSSQTRQKGVQSYFERKSFLARSWILLVFNFGILSFCFVELLLLLLLLFQFSLLVVVCFLRYG